MSGNVLEVSDLRVEFRLHAQGVLRAVDGVSFRVPHGKTVALVGESGSGKSVISQSVMGILPSAARIGGGTIRFRADPGAGEGVDIAALDPRRPDDAGDPRRADLDDLPGADDIALAAAHRGGPDR